MLDKNGVEIRTGDVVKISGAYFKNANGIYFVESSPGDPSWCGTDHALKKIGKNGKISTAKYSLCFWPLLSFTNDRNKAAESRAWNADHAEIEHATVKSTDEIAGFFEDRAASDEYWLDKRKWDWGEDHPEIKRGREIVAFFRGVAARVRAAA